MRPIGRGLRAAMKWTYDRLLLLVGLTLIAGALDLDLVRWLLFVAGLALIFMYERECIEREYALTRYDKETA